MSNSQKTIYNALPKLPHFNFHELHEPARGHGRKQYCYRDADGMRMVLSDDAGAAGAGANATEGGCGVPVRVVLDHFPEWKTLDDKVLRFFAYYTEIVDESMAEESRVRKVKISYFLGNGTLTIAETPAVENSGLRKGTTVSRFREEGIDVFSLCIGGTIHCRGITYTLVDCDAATREFFDVMGMPQPDPLNYPFDTFEDKALRQPLPMDEHHVAMRRAVEMEAARLAGTHTSLLTPEERVRARDFFEHDRDVLRFFAVWDKREFRVNYYIADGTISVMFDPADNDGRDRNAVFARRTMVPKDTRGVLLSTETLNRPLGAPPLFLTIDDLRIGETVDIYGRPFFIYDCDPHTRAYMQARGIDLPAHPRPQTERDLFAASRRRPQLQGGSHEAGASAKPKKQFGASSMVFDDSAGTKDALKMTRFSQDVFRFAGRIAQPAEEDEGRRFVISYYLADDTVSVYEILIHNTGHLGGKIFARRAVPGIDEPGKMTVGGTVRLDSVDYVLEEMDERTQRYLAAGMPHMEEHYFRTIDIVAKAQQGVLQKFSRITDAFRHYASSSTQGLTRANVLEVLSDGGVRVTDGELDLVMERVDADKDGWVSLADFTENFMNEKFISDFVPRDPASRSSPASAATVVQRGPIRSAHAIAQRENAAKAADEALRQLLIRVEARRTLLIRSFRNAAAVSYDGNLGMEDFTDCITQWLKLSFSDDDLGALLYKFFFTPGMTNWVARRLPINEVERLIKL